MANGVSTTNIENRVVLSDELIVNADGQTGVQTVDDFAAQMAQTGRFGYLTQSVLFATIKGRGNGAVHYTLDGYAYVEDTENPVIVANGVYLRVLGDEITTKHLGATANGTYVPISEEMVALHDYLNVGDSWDFFALEWIARVPSGDTRDFRVSGGTHIVNRSVGGEIVSGGGKSHLQSLRGIPKVSRIEAYSGGTWAASDFVVNLADNGPSLTRRTITGVIFDAAGYAGALDTSYTASNGAGAGHYFEDVRALNAGPASIAWKADNNDEATTLRCSAAHSDVDGVAYQCIAPGGPIYLDGLWVAKGITRLAAQNITCTSSLMGGISIAGGPSFIKLTGGQIGQSIYDIDGTNYAIGIHLEEGVDVFSVSIDETYCLYEETSEEIDGYLFGGKGSFAVRRAVHVYDAAVHVPPIYTESGFSGKLFMDTIGTSLSGSAPVIADFEGVRFKNVDVSDATNVRVSQGLNTSVFSTGVNTVNVRAEAVGAGGGIQLHPGDGAHIIEILAQIENIDDSTSHYIATMVGGALVLATRKSGSTSMEFWTSNSGVRVNAGSFMPSGNLDLKSHALLSTQSVRLTPQDTAPTSGVLNGSIAVSDGTWGGGGAGLYRYNGSTWVFIG